MTRSAQRILAVVILLALGLLSLPVSASLLDGGAGEDWIVPVQLIAMALLGAAVCLALPGLAREGAGTARRAVTGAWWGLVAALVGVTVLWLLVSGLGGA